MKLSQELERLINNQINNEYQSAYIYLGMAAYFEGTPYGGFARWMRQQSAEELDHGGKFFSYLLVRGGKIELKGIEKVTSKFDSIVAPFAIAHAHEQRVTRWIHDIYELSLLEKDYETVEFLRWFIQEQLEEEQQTKNWLDRLTLAANYPDAILRLDHEAGKRGR
jgi:ferritin